MTSYPLILPTFARRKSTVKFPPANLEKPSCRLVYKNSVYESPKPNGYLGSYPSARYPTPRPSAYFISQLPSVLCLAGKLPKVGTSSSFIGHDVANLPLGHVMPVRMSVMAWEPS